MKLGIIGCGKMGTALVEGAVRSGAVKGADVTGVDPYASAREQFAKATGATTTEDISALADCEVILLCTKPHDVRAALAAVTAARGGASMLVISIAAGITLAALEAAVSEKSRVIRVMPNTPSLVGKGAAGFCMGASATAEDGETARRLLEAVGIGIEVPERLMNAVTGVSGSGPAYVYLIIEALADGGLKNGLSRADALRLAAQTVLGAATMVMETGEHPAVLKDMVTSPGGTTIAGLAALESHGLRAAMIAAVDAATGRASELGA